MKLDIIIEVKDSRERYKAEKQNLTALLSLKPACRLRAVNITFPNLLPSFPRIWPRYSSKHIYKTSQKISLRHEND